jgi:Uma2 family endonuclease
MQISLNQILELPHAALLAEQIQSALEKENAEREYFYETIEEGKKMEFINGEIVFQSPAKLRHISSIKLLMKLLDTFVYRQDLGYVGSEKMLVSLTRNDYEPDICFFEKGKAENFKPDQMQFPTPDFIVEVLSPSTEKFDRDTKFLDYAAHGVTEYWIVDPENETVEQYVLQAERYELLLKAKDGTIQSIVLPDFKIQIRAVFDEQLNLEELKRLI